MIHQKIGPEMIPIRIIPIIFTTEEFIMISLPFARQLSGKIHCLAYEPISER